MRRLFRHHRRPGVRLGQRRRQLDPHLPRSSGRAFCGSPDITVIRVILPGHLRALAHVGSGVQLFVEGPVTQRSVLDALDAQYPMLRRAILDHVTQWSRPAVLSKFDHPAPTRDVETMAYLGSYVSLAAVLGINLLVATDLYVIPNTCALGAILLTGYLGGAVATHLRVGDPLFSHILFPTYLGALLWGGLYLREPRLRALLPLRRPNAPSQPR